MITEAASLYLGPAEVLSVSGETDLVQVRLGTDETLWAKLALAVSYLPEPGDEVLVIRRESSEAYLIGVLKGRGTTTFRVPGDMTLHAPQGNIRLTAGKNVQIQSEDAVEIVARKATFRVKRLNVMATAVVEHIGNVYSWVTGLVQIKSRRMRTVTDESWLVRAGRGHVKTSGNMCINGKTIHLG
ncbi:MAG: DUF3540 domain-containing protein [Candidatus Manganitrophaceae bacterium]